MNHESNVKYVYINEVLGANYPTSREAIWKYHTLKGIKGEPVEPDKVPRHFEVYPRAIRIDRRVPTTVVWVNETNGPVPFRHDVIGNQTIPKGGFLTHTFQPDSHPPGSLYYRVSDDNQPGNTIGYPPQN